MNSLLNLYHSPLPPLFPLHPPTQVLTQIKQLKKSDQIASLSLSAVPEQQVEDDESNPFKQMYEQKCEIESILKSKCKSQQEIIKILQQKNTALQKQISRLQQERWKKFDYSKLSARGRSKSQKKIPPTIEVKVPKRMRQNEQIFIDDDKFIKTDRDIHHQQMEYYRQQIRQCRQENKQLKQQIQNLNMLVKKLEQQKKAIPIHRDNYVESINFSKSAKSPHKDQAKKSHNTATPIISPFSPNGKQSSETVKKDMGSFEQSVYQLKKMKNQMMYKDLLVDKMRNDHAKQVNILKKHLQLTVIESSKISEQIQSIVGSFKAQIIRLSQQLLQYKGRRSLGRDQKMERQFSQGQLVSILKERREGRITT